MTSSPTKDRINRQSARDRIDWKTERDRINLADVATALLGAPPGRRGEHGRRSWWNCPIHDDANPSFCVDPERGTWYCFGCGEHGDAASLVMRIKGIPFPEAVAYLTGGALPAGQDVPRPKPPDRRGSKPPAGPSGLPEAEALALVAESSARLWSPEGSEALAYLTGPRCLTPETIRAARLGWTPGTRLTTKDGRTYHARGIVIPWFDRGRLSLLKIRQPEGDRPKYAEVFRDRPGLYPGPEAIRPGGPLVITEGEFDALLLGQDLGDRAAVVTLGSASGRPDARCLGPLLPAYPWFVATDADPAGDDAFRHWPARSRRVRPPAPFKDWTEARQGGVNLRRWWSDRLGGGAPPLFTWHELATWRWAGADRSDNVLVIDRPDPARRRIALEALADDPE